MAFPDFRMHCFVCYHSTRVFLPRAYHCIVVLYLVLLCLCSGWVRIQGAKIDSCLNYELFYRVNYSMIRPRFFKWIDRLLRQNFDDVGAADGCHHRWCRLDDSDTMANECHSSPPWLWFMVSGSRRYHHRAPKVIMNCAADFFLCPWLIRRSDNYMCGPESAR